MNTNEPTRGSATIALTLLAILALIGGGALYLNQQSPADTNVIATEATADAEMQETQVDSEASNPDASETNPAEPSANNTVASADAGTYQDYAPEKLALAEDGTVVLFFHASWCPSCRALENDLNANLDDIPADVHILQIDYDTATALKQQYGIVRQHTLVEVDAEGNEIQTLTGVTNTLNQVVNQL